MNAGDCGANASKGPAAWASGFGVPSFELAGGSTEPQEDAVFLRFCGLLGETLTKEEAFEAGCCCQRAACEALEEEAAVELVISGVAGGGHRGRWVVHRGTIRNSGLVTRA